MWRLGLAGRRIKRMEVRRQAAAQTSYRHFLGHVWKGRIVAPYPIL